MSIIFITRKGFSEGKGWHQSAWSLLHTLSSFACVLFELQLTTALGTHGAPLPKLTTDG